MKDNHTSKKLFLFAGEPSGDLHGSRLIHFLKEQSPNIIIEGVAGPKMRQKGVKGPLEMEAFEVMGFIDVLLALPKLIKQFYIVRDTILNNHPDAVVLIDYPGFNLRLAKALRKKGFKGKIIHYISPSVWAWGQHRIKEMEKTLDLLLTIYPFEAHYFSHTTLPVKYVGSPLQEYLKLHHYNNDWQQTFGISQELPLFALFPGSRQGEISRNLPIMLEAACMLKKNNKDLLFGISCCNEEATALIKKTIKNYPVLKESLSLIPQKLSYELMRDSRCAIAKSGTVTLELALHKCPTVVIYRLPLMNRLYAQHVLKLKLPYYCIVNILAEREVFPELIEKGLNPPNLYEKAKSLFTYESTRKDCIRSCEEIEKSLGCHPANFKAAESILELLQC